jgi:hypothetical protein
MSILELVLRSEMYSMLYSQYALRRDPILLPFHIPLRLRDRRQYARDGLPLGDAQARFGQSGKTANDDDTKDES